MRQIPKVSFLKVLKNAKQILQNPLPFHHKNFTKYGDTFRVGIGFGKSVIFTRDPKLAKHMLQEQHRNYYKSPLQSKDLARYIGNGLLTSNGAYWLQQRRLIQPAFYKKKLDVLAVTIRDAIDKALVDIRVDTPMDVYPLMNDLAFQVVAKSLFSYTDTGTTIARLQEITATAQTTLIKEIRQPYKRWWLYLSGQIKKTMLLKQEARDLLEALLIARRKDTASYDDLLDLLLAAEYEDGSKMSNAQLIDEILILFVAGHETTSNALTFSILLLAQHPDIQQRVYREVMALPTETLSMQEQLAALPYTKQCIEEAMRLYPPVYFSDRIAIEPDTYEGMQIPKGTTFLISFYEMHRNASAWQDPEAFCPDRFDPAYKKTYMQHYFPFGAGPRMCVGSHFAMYEMIMTLSKLVKQYRIHTKVSDIRIAPLITLQPLEAIVQFEKR